MSDPNELPLPEMNDAVLGEEELAALFRDYCTCTSGIDIQVKLGPGLVGSHPQPSLEEARQLLLERRVRGLQFRYAFDGSRWCDTLMSTSSGVRLIRIRQ